MIISQFREKIINEKIVKINNITKFNENNN